MICGEVCIGLDDSEVFGRVGLEVVSTGVRVGFGVDVCGVGEVTVNVEVEVEGRYVAWESEKNPPEYRGTTV